MKNEINWDEVRVQAAIAMAPRCHELAQDILMRGGDIFPCKTLPECLAVNAVIYADELVKELQKGQATDYYREGYRDALDKVRSAIVNGMNNIDRLNAIRLLLHGEDHEQGDLEMKEVNLEKEIDAYWDKYCNDEFGELLERDSASFDNVAKHFFELGLKVKKGEQYE